MLKDTMIEISDLPDFFKNLEGGVTIQPVLYCEKDIRGGFRLVLEGGEKPLTVTEQSRPLWFGGVRDTLPILRAGHVYERLADEARVDLRGCF